jgi:thiamine-monophosphate kinase
MTTERECIDSILQFVQDQDKENLVRGIGDDCAVLEKDGNSCLLLTTDTLVTGVHFDLTWHPPNLLGRKCASVNLSDIAAMGGQPHSCLLSVCFPGSVPVWFDEFMAGFVSVLKEHGVILVGGDTVSSSNDFMISVVMTGEAKKDQICYRSGAEPGDLVWVSGPLGRAAAGLELCRGGYCTPDWATEKWQQLIKAHLDPEALIDLGLALCSSGIITAMMDISDGLATDLAHLCSESRVGAEVRQEDLPGADLLESAAAELNTAVLDWILKGGEDYQLLFTTRESEKQELQKLVAGLDGVEVHCIGRINRKQGVFLVSNSSKPQDISYQGYEHFTEDSKK